MNVVCPTSAAIDACVPESFVIATDRASEWNSDSVITKEKKKKHKDKDKHTG